MESTIVFSLAVIYFLWQIKLGELFTHHYFPHSYDPKKVMFDHVVILQEKIPVNIGYCIHI